MLSVWTNFPLRAAPFIYDTWKHPETLAIISQIAGIELVPEMDFEIAHINLSSKSEAQKAEELTTIRERRLTEEDEGISGCPWEDDKPIVDWHTDSYPFVCVTMLSDCTHMVGGETALRTGDGSIIKVRGPGQVRSKVLWGFEPSSHVHRVAQLYCKVVTSSTRLFELLAKRKELRQ